MVVRVVCLAVGYLFGCFLTADLVARKKLGASAFEVGSGNPGMANIGSLLGVKWAAETLAGDIGKTLLACLICRFILAPGLGQLATLWAGLGATIGHDAPFWHRFKGGKGVTTSASTIVLFDPVWGMAALILGLVIVIVSKQLCYGAVAIQAIFLFIVCMRFGLGEAALLCSMLFLFTLMCHGGPCWRALHGKEPQTDFLSKLHSSR